MTYNVDTFTLAAASLVSTGALADTRSHDFAPQAFYGLIENAQTVDTITALLCGKRYVSKKGKANASALPDSVKRALGSVKRAWTNYAVIPSVANIVHAYIGQLTDVESVTIESDFLAACAVKGKEPSDARRLTYLNAALLAKYAGRPLTFGAFNAAVAKAIAEHNTPATSDDVDVDSDDVPATSDDVAFGPAEPVSEATVIADMVAYVEFMSNEAIDENNAGLAALHKAITDAMNRALAAVELSEAA